MLWFSKGSFVASGDIGQMIWWNFFSSTFSLCIVFKCRVFVETLPSFIWRTPQISTYTEIKNKMFKSLVLMLYLLTYSIAKKNNNNENCRSMARNRTLTQKSSKNRSWRSGSSLDYSPLNLGNISVIYFYYRSWKNLVEQAMMMMMIHLLLLNPEFRHTWMDSGCFLMYTRV